MKLIYNPIGFRTMLTRETMRYLKIWKQSLLTPLLSNLLFFGVFGGMFSTRAVGLDGIGYLQFLVPGICFMGVVNASFLNSSSSFIIQKFQNVIQDINSYPLTDFEKTAAHVIAGSIRGMFVATVTLIATIPFAGFSIAHPFLFFGTLLMISMMFSAIGVMVGLYAESFEATNFILNLLITPLTYLGGVFFEITKLPGWLGTLALFNPMVPMIDLIRFTYLGQSELWPFASAIVVALITILLIASAYMFMRQRVGLRT